MRPARATISRTSAIFAFSGMVPVRAGEKVADNALRNRDRSPGCASGRGVGVRLGFDFGLERQRIGRIAQRFDVFVTQLDRSEYARMREDVKARIAHGVERGFRDVVGREAARTHGALQLQIGGLLRARGRRVVAQIVGTAALGVGDARRHEGRTQQRAAHHVAHVLEVVIERFGERDHRVLRRVVDAHRGRRQQTRHRRRIDDMRALALLEHDRREAAHAVRHAHHVHAENPLPVLRAAFPQEAARAHARVVEQQMDLAIGLDRRLRERVDLGGIAYVGAHADRLRALLADCLHSGVERGGVDVGEHEFHAERGGLLRERAAKAARRAGDDGHAAFELKWIGHRVSGAIR
ncbi:hypothetical protein PT2222_310035 [Paraburkholderia tropica]